jgi:hypothetical protein
LTLENNEGRPFLVADEIRKLKELVDEGVLTQAEFEEKKAQLLGTGSDTGAEPREAAPAEPQPEPEPVEPLPSPVQQEAPVMTQYAAEPVSEDATPFSAAKPASKKKKIIILSAVLAAVVIAAALLVYFLFLRGSKLSKEERMIAGNWKVEMVSGDSGTVPVTSETWPLILKDDLTGSFSFGDNTMKFTWNFKSQSDEETYLYALHFQISGAPSETIVMYSKDSQGDYLIFKLGDYYLILRRN